MADLVSWLGSAFVRSGASADPTPVSAPARSPVMAYETYDLSSIESSEELASFMRNGLSNATGKPVSEAAAMSNATFNRAVTVTTSTIGHLPLNLYRRAANGDIEKAKDHPVYRLLRVRPNTAQTPYQFKSYMQGRALLKGDAFAFIVPGVRGPQALWPLDPDRVTVEQASDFSLSYRYNPLKGGERVYESRQIMHLRAPWSTDGIRGVGLLKLAKEALGLANISDEAAARMLRNGSYVGGVLQHPGALSMEAQARLRAQFEEKFSGVENRGRWIVAEEGLEAKPLGATGKDAEGLAQRQYQAEEVSRFTGVPRPLLMFDETSWGSGIEQLGLFFVTYCLLPWFNAWEEAGAAALLTDAERETHYLKFNEAALLRGSLKDQAEFLSKAIGGPGQGGFMLPDEAREKMDMNRMDHPAGQRPAWVQEDNTNAS